MEQTNSTSITSPMFSAFKASEKLSFIRPYDPKQAIPAEGYRHAVVRFRDTGKNTVSRLAQMVTVPQVTLPDEFLLDDKATKVFLGVIEDQQDEYIRGCILSDQKVVSWSDLSVGNMLDLLTAVRVSQRLTSEQIGNWFDVAMTSITRQRGTELAAAKLITEPLKIAAQVASTHEAYKIRFMRLAAPVPQLDQQAAIAVKNLLAVANVSDDVAKALAAKIEAILNPPAANNGDL